MNLINFKYEKVEWRDLILKNSVNTEISVNDKRINFNPKPISKSKQLFIYICLIEVLQENDTQITDSWCTKVYTYCIGTLVKLSFQNTVAFHPLHYTEQPKWNNGPGPLLIWFPFGMACCCVLYSGNSKCKIASKYSIGSLCPNRIDTV